MESSNETYVIPLSWSHRVCINAGLVTRWNTYCLRWRGSYSAGVAGYVGRMVGWVVTMLWRQARGCDRDVKPDRYHVMRNGTIEGKDFFHESIDRWCRFWWPGSC